jgi:solute carrier family 25 protein 39/40
VGSLLTALLVSPIDVVKVRMQVNAPPPVFQTSSRPLVANVACAALPSLVSKRLSSPPVTLGVFPGGAPAASSAAASAASAASSAAPRSLVQCSSCGTLLLHNGLSDTLLPANLHAPRTPPPPLSNVYATGSIPRIIGHICRTEGLAGLYAGLAPTLLMSVPNTVLYFTAYDNLRLSFPAAGPFLCGSAARVFSSTLVSPFELIRTRAMVLNADGGAARTSIFNEAAKLVEAGGVRNLWSGLAASLWRDVPFSGVYWLSAETCRGEIYRRLRRRDPAPPSPLQTFSVEFASGALSGVLAACCTTPFDVVKTRRQTEVAIELNTAKDLLPPRAPPCDHAGLLAAPRRCYNTAASDPPPSSTFGQLRMIYAEEGVNGLWRGNVARCARVAPACAIMLGTYELGKTVFIQGGL